MKKIASLLLCSILSASLVSCSQKETATSSVQETVTEAVTETITETTAEPETEEVTEQAAEPEYFGQLVYPDTMTDKEKANTAYRDFTLIYFDKAREIGDYNFTYSINTTTYEYVKEIEDYIRELKIYDEQTCK